MYSFVNTSCGRETVVALQVEGEGFVKNLTKKLLTSFRSKLFSEGFFFYWDHIWCFQSENGATLLYKHINLDDFMGNF